MKACGYEKEYDELVRKTQEARRQKQLEALKNFKIDSKISHKSPQKSGIQNEYKLN